MTSPLLSQVRPIFRAIATVVVPEATALTPAEWDEVERTVESALETRPAALRRQLVAFLRAINLLSVARYGRVLTALSPVQRTTFLSRIERAPLLLLRRGFWGVRTLVFMGYYTRPAAHEAIGYRARAAGWAARGGTATVVPFPTMDVTVEPV
jgi:hypothetical protein